jgi:hypothetical protein
MIKCKECKFWEKYNNNNMLGQCKKSSPGLDPKGYAAWPETKSSAGCHSGEKKLEMLNE